MGEIALNSPEQLPSDTEWYNRYKEVGSFTDFVYLRGDKGFRDEQKRKFLAAEIVNPSLDYPDIKPEELTSKEEALLGLKREIIQREPNEAILWAYRWRINEKIVQLRMLKAAAAGDMRRFRRYTEFIYGKPSAEVFAYTVTRLRSQIEPFLGSGDKDIQAAVEEAYKALPATLLDIKISSLPTKEEFGLAKERTKEEVGVLVNIPETAETEKEFKAEDIRQVFDQALRTLRAEGWEVVVSSEAGAITVIQEKRRVEIPPSRVLTTKRLRALIAHEIGTHVLRRVKGERSKLMLLGLGLDRYDRGEEGVATMREQVITGEKLEDFSGLDGHLAISLAYGLDGKPRDFRGVYEVLRKYYFFQKLIEGKNRQDAEVEANSRAYERTERTFRGSDCKTPGACFTLDIVYREGNIGVWEVIREKPEEMTRFSIGKYDPHNPRHIWILSQLGIGEKDLQELEK